MSCCNLKLVLSLLNSHGSTVSTYVLNVVLNQMTINCKKKNEIQEEQTHGKFDGKINEMKKQ